MKLTHPSRSVRVAGLPMSCRSAAKRRASRRVRSSARSRSSSSATSSADLSAVGGQIPLDLEQPCAAPRACGRGRRGDGWRSARRRAGPRPRAARPRVAPTSSSSRRPASGSGPVEQRRPARRTGARRRSRRSGAASRAGQGHGAGIGLQAQAGGDPGRPQDPDRIVGERAARGGAQGRRLEVAEAAGRIERRSAVERNRDRVDGEVAEPQIELDRVPA